MLGSLTRKDVERTFNSWAKEFDDERGIIDVHVRPDNRFSCALFIAGGEQNPCAALLEVGSGKPVVPDQEL